MNKQEPVTAAPDDLFAGTVLVTVPHFDDAVLGCGGSLLQVRDKTNLHVVYCTRGECEGFDRAQEARNALKEIGIPPEQITLLNFPDWHLDNHRAELRKALEELIARIKPVRVLTPFRYDRHPDHVVLNDVVRACAGSSSAPFEVMSYFVYFTWRMLPGSDIRRHIRRNLLAQVDTTKTASRKRELIALFKSQTEAHAPGQKRPALVADHLDSACGPREYFLRHAETITDAGLFTLPLPFVRAVHWLEPHAKVIKERLRTRFTPRTGI